MIERECPTDARACKGFTVHKPLFTVIPWKNILSPVLHSCDLFVNDFMDLLFLKVDHRLENRSLKIINVRNREADAAIAVLKAEDWLELCEGLLRMADNDEKDDAIAAVTQAKHDLKEAKRIKQSTSAEARRLEGLKENGFMVQPLWQEIDACLVEVFHILRSSYHGGDMEGNHCRRLARRAVDAIDALQNIMLKVPQGEQAPGCTDKEIEDFCAAVKCMLQYFNLLSHYCYETAT